MTIGFGMRAGVACGLLASVAAIGTVVAPAPAGAEPEVPSGDYRIQYADGEADTWTFTPCGPTCTSASTPDDPFVTDWQFQLHEGRWTFSGPNALSCPAGGTVPIAVVYGFDPVTFAGQGQATLATGNCGRPAGTTMVRTFQLTKL